MPRIVRVVLPNYPHHVVQRGHNRQVVFAADYDYQRYLTDLRELKDAFGVKVYAYCLMTNHVHLLLVPGDSAAGLGQLMKALAARATRYRNRIERRSGILWESRYKSSVVQSDTYLLACARYIELNPVRARMTAEAGDYAWSSYCERIGQDTGSGLLDTDPCFLALGCDHDERCERYKSFVKQGMRTDEICLIRNALQRGQLTGNKRFIDEIELVTGHRIEQRGQGRPKKNIKK
ncbi:transposase [Pseudomonas sp. EL_65y_Pfl2_R95]|uniref:transposase n=1 Tax=Pseudomonas sp. EL_65y_Pfl2_R95 TaxID=3088698 RepID=UPI0030D7E2B5